MTLTDEQIIGQLTASKKPVVHMVGVRFAELVEENIELKQLLAECSSIRNEMNADIATIATHLKVKFEPIKSFRQRLYSALEMKVIR